MPNGRILAKLAYLAPGGRTLGSQNSKLFSRVFAKNPNVNIIRFVPKYKELRLFEIHMSVSVKICSVAIGRPSTKFLQNRLDLFYEV